MFQNDTIEEKPITLHPLTIDLTSSKKEKEDRDYQIRTADEAVNSLKTFKKINIISPTGTGKTYISVLISKHENLREVLGIKKNKKIKILFLAHMHHLLFQAQKVYMEEPNVEVILQSVFQPVPKEVIQNGWDLCFMDESHHEPIMSIQEQLPYIMHKPIIGFTATPRRSDNLLLKFEKEIYSISREEAVARGFIAETDLHTVMDLSGVNKFEITSILLKKFHEEMNRCIIFMRTKKEALSINKYLEGLNRSSVSLSDNMSGTEVTKALSAFSNGKLDFIVNCGKINEGIDVSGCDNVILAKEYLSIGQMNQNIGRAARPDSDCNVWQLSPLNKKSLDARDIVGKPKSHRLIEIYHDYCDYNYF